ncbi:MAG: hypothetical protein J0M08_14235, partial [Bacteroidetes bacterium]|nr:hypothetical protein [Bacteroidota bacterium]
YQKARQQFRADEYKIPHHRQYLPVSCNGNQSLTMTKSKIKSYLDLIPLLILTISAVILLWKYASGEGGLFWKHYLGLLLLPVNYLLFALRHKIGVLALGLTLFLGLFSLLSYSPAGNTTTLYKEFGDAKLPFFYGQPIFLVWIIVHFILSARHYVGIATKKYWDGLINNKEVSFD